MALVKQLYKLTDSDRSLSTVAHFQIIKNPGNYGQKIRKLRPVTGPILTLSSMSLVIGPASLSETKSEKAILGNIPLLI